MSDINNPFSSINATSYPSSTLYPFLKNTLDENDVLDYIKTNFINQKMSGKIVEDIGHFMTSLINEKTWESQSFKKKISTR